VQQSFLDAELLRGHVFFLCSKGPVISIVPNSDDDFLRRNDFENLTQIFDEPVLGGDGAGGEVSQCWS